MTNNLSNEMYRSPKNLAYMSIAGLGIIALIESMTVIFGFGQIVSPDSEFGSGESLWIILQSLAALTQFPVYIFTIVCFLMWLNRANKNLTPLRSTNIEYSSGWAVGWWFIPFANLVKPLHVVQEVWTESDPDFNPELGFLSNAVSTPSLLYFWWGFWIVSNFASNLSSRMLDGGDPNIIVFSGYAFIASGLLTLIAAILAIKVVLGITQRQEERFPKVGSFLQPWQTPPAPPTFE
jgi:hypothetical protein